MRTCSDSERDCNQSLYDSLSKPTLVNQGNHAKRSLKPFGCLLDRTEKQAGPRKDICTSDSIKNIPGKVSAWVLSKTIRLRDLHIHSWLLFSRATYFSAIDKLQ